VPELVVDVLETVEIDEQHRRPVAVGRLVELLHQVQPVRQARQGVVQGLVGVVVCEAFEDRRDVCDGEPAAGHPDHDGVGDGPRAAACEDCGTRSGDRGVVRHDQGLLGDHLDHGAPRVEQAPVAQAPGQRGLEGGPIDQHRAVRGLQDDAAQRPVAAEQLVDLGRAAVPGDEHGRDGDVGQHATGPGTLPHP
jgi:hypothetical protein